MVFIIYGMKVSICLLKMTTCKRREIKEITTKKYESHSNISFIIFSSLFQFYDEYINTLMLSSWQF